MQPRAFEGVFIPAAIWLSPALTPLEKMLITEVRSLDNKFGCTATNKYLGEFLHCSANTVSRLLRELSDKKYLSIAYRNEATKEGRVIRILPTPDPNKQEKKTRKKATQIDNPPYQIDKGATQIDNPPYQIDKQGENLGTYLGETIITVIRSQKRKKRIPPNSAAPP
jgi:DNA-binding MarR family transcriptional regulator